MDILCYLPELYCMWKPTKRVTSILWNASKKVIWVDNLAIQLNAEKSVYPHRNNYTTANLKDNPTPNCV